MRPTPQLLFWSCIYSGITEFLLSCSSFLSRVFQVLNAGIPFPYLPSNNLSACSGMTYPCFTGKGTSAGCSCYVAFYETHLHPPLNLPCLNLFYCLVCTTPTFAWVWYRMTTLWLWSWTSSMAQTTTFVVGSVKMNISSISSWGRDVLAVLVPTLLSTHYFVFLCSQWRTTQSYCTCATMELYSVFLMLEFHVSYWMCIFVRSFTSYVHLITRESHLSPVPFLLPFFFFFFI